jgi:hypothetical protein
LTVLRGSFALLPRGQTALQCQPDRLVYRDPHDARVLVHPPVAVEHSILAGAKVARAEVYFGWDLRE